MLSRRAFVATAAAAPFAAAAAPSALPIRKAVLISMLPKSMSYAERFKLAKDVGFAAVECQTITDPAEVEEIKKA